MRIKVYRPLFSTIADLLNASLRFQQAGTGPDVRHGHTCLNAGCVNNPVALVVNLAAGSLETENPLPEIGIEIFSIDVRTDLRFLSVKGSVTNENDRVLSPPPVGFGSPR